MLTHKIRKADIMTAFTRTTRRCFLGSREMGVQMWRYIKSVDDEVEYTLFMSRIEMICNGFFGRVAEVGKCNIKFYRSFKYRCYHARTRINNDLKNGEEKEN